MNRGIKALIGIIVMATVATAFALSAWTPPVKQPKLELTRAEFDWLQEHGNTIRLAPLPDSPPVDYIDVTGQHLGLTSDYIRLIEQMLGIRFQIIECDNWKQIEEKLKAQEVDMVCSVQDSINRREFLRFTRSYMDLPCIILTRTERSGKFTLDNMYDMKIAIVEGSAHQDYVKKAHPSYTLIPVPDAATGFRKVSLNGADAMIADQGVASFYIEALGINNLRVAGDIDYPWELSLASRKDWPLFSSILDKALANITPEQRRAIKKRWITLSDSGHIPRDRYLNFIGIVFMITVLTIGSIMLWNRTLRRQVNTHSKELGRIKESHEQATKALDESEKRFKSMIESSNDIIWEKDNFGVFIYISPRVVDILGYRPEELIGRSSISLMSQKDADRNLEFFRSSNAESFMDCDISTYLDRNGREVILESSGMAFPDQNGDLGGFRGVSRNITQRIASESALRRSEQRFRNLVETTSDWIWEIDTAGNYTYASPQSAELLGLNSKELIDKHFTHFMPPIEAAANKAMLVNIVSRGGSIDALITNNLHIDGRTVVLESSAVPFYDKNWTIQGYRGVSRDVTDRIAAEKQIQFERKLFKTFMKHAPDLIYFKDAEGRFIEVNAAKAAELHLEPEDLIGRTDFDYLPLEQAKKRKQDEEEVMRTRQPIQLEEVTSTPNGEQWYLTTKVPRYDENGLVIGTFGTSWNITFRKAAKEELRRLRALLNNTFDSMPSILIGVNAKGTVIQWNRQAELATGQSKSEAINQPLAVIYPQLAKEMIKVNRAIRERLTQKEERIKVQDGDHTRYNDITVYPLLEGDTEGAVIRIDDVSDRVLIEDSIRNIVEGVATVDRSFFSAMVNQLAKTLDADFTFISEFTDKNKSRMRTLAFSNKGTSADNFEYDLADTPCQFALRGEDCVYFDDIKTHFSEPELLRELEVHSYIGIPLIDSQGNAQGVMVALYQEPIKSVDFAKSIIQVFAGRSASELERLQATKDLVALRNRLENIINSMPSILVGVDANGLVMQWNLEAEKITGIESAQAQGKKLELIFPDLGNEMDLLLKNVNTHNTERHERVHCTIQGDPQIVDVTIYPIKSDGTEGAVIRVDVVTDRVRIEEMMVQSEKMMSVGGLAAGMAHEINNPLTGILQSLQVMQNRISQPTPINTGAAEEAGTTLESIQAYMEKRGLMSMMTSISEAGQRAAKIVDNMLSFSRKDEAHFAPNNIEEIIERSIELASNEYNLEKRFDFRHIKLVREFEDLPLIPCESSQIQQVMLNLLSNSAQAMMIDRPENASAPMIIIRVKNQKNTVLIEIEDNGPGMDAETRKRAFEPFFTTKDVGHGTGLGLSVSYFIITENHGGTMNLVSAAGRGACFSIRIPFEHRTARWGLRL